MATSADYIDLNEGTAPATPGTGKRRIYAKTDGVYEKDDSGTESGLNGGGDTATVPTELAYKEITSNVNVTATSEATADTIVTADAFTPDGSTVVMLEFWSYLVTPENADGVHMIFYLYDGSTSLGNVGQITHGGTAQQRPGPVYIRRRLTPTAAAHTYSIRCSTGSGTAVVGASSAAPAFIRATSVVTS